MVVADLHFCKRAFGGFHLWHFNNDSGRVYFIIIIEFKDLPRLKRDRDSVLFFLMMEKTLFSAALLCGMTRTDIAISENIGKMVFRKPQTTSIRKYPSPILVFSQILEKFLLWLKTGSP